MSAVEKFEVKPMGKNSQETRLSLLEQSIHHIKESIDRLDRNIAGGFHGVDDRLHKMEQKIDKMEGRLDKFSDRLWSNFLWLIGTMFTLATLCCGIMAKGFGWFN